MYRYVDAVVVRASLWPAATLQPAAPDMDGGTAGWRAWLDQVLAVEGFGAAVEHASPSLAGRAHALCDGHELGADDARRVALAVLRYLLRARARSTPFGLFAGVAPVGVTDRATVGLGTAHRAVARVEGEWLAAVIDELEADPTLRRGLHVQANTLISERDGRLLLAYRSHRRPGGSPGHVTMRATRPACAALAAAADPISLDELAARLADAFPEVAAVAVQRLLSSLVDQRMLVTSLRPPMTAAAPLAAVARAGAHAQHPSGPPSVLLTAVQAAHRVATRHNQRRAGESGHLRCDLDAALRAAHPTDTSPLGLDVHLDASVDIPLIVAAEAERAAAALTRLAPADPDPGWRQWHGRFLERFGPHALVPVLDAVDPDLGLGFPAGYRDTAPLPPPSLTDRDAALLVLAQDAALRGQHEIVLDDTAIGRLAGTGLSSPIRPSTEIMARLQAPTAAAIGRGAFRLDIVGVSRAAGATTGRFVDLFDAAARARMVAVYAALPTVVSGALRAQLSAPLLHASTDTVARSLQMLPFVLALGECRPDSRTVIELGDLAVTADPDRVYLVSLSRRQVVEPVMLNAVASVGRMLPLAQFLAEAPAALAAPCLPFTWGPAADRLPFLPAVRYGRSLLSPARWLLAPQQLGARRTSEPVWQGALDQWQRDTGCPPHVHLGGSDQRIELDLTLPAHRALLRAHLDRDRPAVLWAAPPVDSDGWIGGHAHEIVIPLAATTAPAPAPRTALPVVDVRRHGRLPGDPSLYLKIYGHPDRQQAILAGHLPDLLEALPDHRWWFLRYRDPEPHLRIRVTSQTSPDAAWTAAGVWVRRLRAAGLTARVQIDTDYPETARFGGPDALSAAEDFFAADSAAALAQLSILDGPNPPDAHALTAASLLDLALGAWERPEPALRWLIEHTTTHRPAPTRAVYRQALALARPDGPAAVLGIDLGQRLATCWARRRRELGSYREAAGTVPVDELLIDLLHLHHTRVIGPHRDSELACLHLARAAALSRLNRHGERP